MEDAVKLYLLAQRQVPPSFPISKTKSAPADELPGTRHEIGHDHKRDVEFAFHLILPITSAAIESFSHLNLKPAYVPPMKILNLYGKQRV